MKLTFAGTARLLASLVACTGAPSLLAGLPEPDTVFHGVIALDGAFVSDFDNNVVVEVRQTESGPAISSYRMGDTPSVGDRYVVRARVESSDPTTDPTATAIGGTVFVVVTRDGTNVVSQSHVITGRGAFVNLNFGDVDSDGDGMSDSFENTYFGSVTGGSANADTDGDGRPNLREFLQGTDPRVADGRHPADRVPADDALTINEVTEYTLAWQTGSAWPIEPVTVPIAYVTRANLIWQSGEAYLFDNSPATNAPNWWVPAPPPAASPALADAADANGSSVVTHSALHTVNAAASTEGQGPLVNAADRQLASSFAFAVPFTVETSVRPVPGVKVYAVEDSVPDSVLVRDISDGGRFDRVNGKVKWGPFFDATPRRLTYQVTPLDGAGAHLEFSGTASFDGSDVTISGQRRASSGVEIDATRLAIGVRGESVQLTFDGTPGRSYIIESSQDLVTWTRVDGVVAGADGRVQAVSPVGPDAAVSFYRVRVDAGAGATP